MSRRVLSALCVLLGAVLVPGASSIAQTTNDPSSGSPAGTVYQLPVDSGRADAAPRGDAKHPGSEATGSPQESTDAADQPGENSLYRSENNFGTSSNVPGAAGTTGAGSESGSPAGVAAAGVTPTSAADTGDTSKTAAIGLIALLVAGGITIGVISRRNWS